MQSGDVLYCDKEIVTDKAMKCKVRTINVREIPGRIIAVSDIHGHVRYIMKLCEENPNVHATMGNVEHHRMSRFYNADSEVFLELLHRTKQVWETGFFLEILDELRIDSRTNQISAGNNETPRH